MYNSIFSFDSVLNGFILDRKSKSRSPKTIKFYLDNIELFVRWMKEQKIDFSNIENITTFHLRSYFIFLGQRRNQSGIHCSFRAIRALLFFYEEEFEPENWKNPIKKIKLSTGQPDVLDGIPLEHVKILIDNCSGIFQLRNEAMFSCLLDTGCRIGEFLKLNLEDIDLVTGNIFIKKENNKNKKSRFVFLGKDSRRKLRRYLRTRPDIKPNSHLWNNVNGNRLQYEGFRKIVIENCDASNLPHYTAHDFRRCCALTLYRNGVSIVDISNILGHRDIKVTQRYLKIDVMDLMKSHSLNNPIDTMRLR